MNLAFVVWNVRSQGHAKYRTPLTTLFFLSSVRLDSRDFIDYRHPILSHRTKSLRRHHLAHRASFHGDMQ